MRQKLQAACFFIDRANVPSADTESAGDSSLEPIPGLISRLLALDLLNPGKPRLVRLWECMQALDNPLCSGLSTPSLQAVSPNLVNSLCSRQTSISPTVRVFRGINCMLRQCQELESVCGKANPGAKFVWVMAQDAQGRAELSSQEVRELIKAIIKQKVEFKLLNMHQGGRDEVKLWSTDAGQFLVLNKIVQEIKNEDAKPATRNKKKQPLSSSRASEIGCDLDSSTTDLQSLETSTTTSSTRDTPGISKCDETESCSSTSKLMSPIQEIITNLSQIMELHYPSTGECFKFDPFAESELSTIQPNDDVKRTLRMRAAIKDYFSSGFAVVNGKDLSDGLDQYFSLISAKLSQDVIKPKFQGWLELHPDIRLTVFSTTASQIFGGFKMKKASKLSSCTGDITAEKLYYQADTKEFLSAENLTKGIEFGRRVIPLPSDYDNDRKHVDDEKQIKLLCFTSEKNMPRHMMLGGIDTIYANGDRQNKVAFNAIIEALLESQKVGIVRYTIRSKTAPRLCGLIPVRKRDGTRLFYLSALPTAENIRDYRFARLVPCTASEEDAVGSLVSGMDLSATAARDPSEIRGLFEPHTLVSPDMRLFHRTLLERGVSDPTAQVSTMDDHMQEEYFPERRIHELAVTLAKRVQEAFRFVEHDIEKSAARARIFWNHLHQEEMQREAAARQRVAEATLAKNKLDGDGEDSEMGDKIPKEISSVTPVSDFMALVNDKKVDRLPFALEAFPKVILGLVVDSPTDGRGHYDKALHCVEAFRAVCLQEDEPASFNNLLRQIVAGKHKSFVRMLLDKKITLIARPECAVAAESYEQTQSFRDEMLALVGALNQMDLADIE